ncbi:MAG: DUF983 domain-containing protein [Kiloniellales bacterium]
MSEGGYRPPVSPFVAGLGCRCPRCGRGRLFDGYLTVAERCDACDLDLQKSDSGDGPAVFLIFIVGALVLPLMFFTERLFAPPEWLHVMLWPIVILALTLGLLRPMKGLLIALQYRNKASEGGSIDYD